MVIDIITIIVFGIVGYVVGSSKNGSKANKINVLLVVLILISANIHGAYIGIDEFKLYVSAIFEGLFGGILIKRLTVASVLQVS